LGNVEYGCLFFWKDASTLSAKIYNAPSFSALKAINILYVVVFIGDGYVFARGIFKRSELSTGMISLTPSSAEFLYGQVTFWFNFYNITPLPAESIAPYQFKVISVSTADEHEEVVGSKEDTLTSNGWISWTLDFCLIESSYLKFVLLNPPYQLHFAIDEVLSVQVKNGK
jgi:hypothetical protein